MKHSLLISALGLSAASFASAQLIITGVIDGDLPDGLPKGLELYVLEDIADLSIYGIGSANNGGGSDGEEYSLDSEIKSSASAGEYLYVASEADGFASYFGFAPTYISGSANINGDDAIELFKNGSVIDTYGEIDVNGDNQIWDYTDSWAYRLDGTIASVTFDSDDWSFGGRSALDGLTAEEAGSTVPFGTFSPDGGIGAIPEPSSLSMLVGLIAGFGLIRRRR